MKIKLLFPCLIILLGPYMGISQSDREKTDLWSDIFSANHFSISISGGRASKALVSADQDKYKINSSGQIVFGGGVNRHLTVKKDFSITAGIHFVGLGRNFEFLIPKEDFEPDYERDVFLNGPTSGEMVFLLRIPATVEKRWFVSKKEYLSLNVGVSLMYSFLQEEETYHSIIYSNGQQVRFLYKFLQTNNNKKPWLNYSVGGGYGWILKNNNLFSINLFTNLSFTKFIKGYYSMEVPSQPIVEGDYSVKGSFIALSGSYIFTGDKKRLQRLKLREK